MRVVSAIVGVLLGFLVGSAFLGLICDTAGCEDSLDVWLGFLTLGLAIAGGVIGYRLPSKITKNANSGESSKYQASFKCSQCGSELRQEGLFCGSCGARKRPISSPATTNKRRFPLLIVIVVIGVIILISVMSSVLTSNSERNVVNPEVPSDVLPVPTAAPAAAPTAVLALDPPTATPVPTATTVPPTATPVPFNRYRSKKFGFSLSYTSAWTVDERVQANAPPEVMPDIVFSDSKTGFTHVIVEIERLSLSQGSINEFVNRRIHRNRGIVADPAGVPIDRINGLLFHGLLKKGEPATRIILVVANGPWAIAVEFIPHPDEEHVGQAPFPAFEWPRINDMVESFELFPTGV
tara:strand:- start:2072 stop:3124 length:1053 start_codon:yes stop_codon:yes gene_type:complete